MALSPKITRMLEETEFFRGISPEHCRALARVCRPKTLKRRDVLFLEESRGDSMYLLLDGSIQLLKTTLDGREIVIRTIQPGEVFAEVILFEQSRYPVTATAVADSEVVGFLREDIMALLDEKDFRDDFIRMLMQKQRYLAERVRYLTSYEIEERFFRFLKEQYGEQTRMTCALSKKDLASAIGTTPESLSRLLASLKRRKTVRWQEKTIELAPDFWRDHSYD